MAGLFDPIIQVAQQAGVFAFYLPFIVAFAIVYGLLNRAQVFGEKSKAINAIIAFAISFYVIGFTPAGITIGQWFGTFFSQSMMVIVTIIVSVLAVFVIGALAPGGKLELKGRSLGAAGVIIALIIVGLFFNSGGLSALGIQSGSAGTAGFFGLSSQDLTIIILIIVTVGIIWWMVREPGEKVSKEDLELLKRVKKGGG